MQSCTGVRWLRVVPSNIGSLAAVADAPEHVSGKLDADPVP